MATMQTSLSGRNRRSAIMAGLLGLGMLGLGFAAVPLYEVFCRVTGYAGTTQRVGEEQAATVQATSKVMSIRFDSNVNSGPLRGGAQNQPNMDILIPGSSGSSSEGDSCGGRESSPHVNKEHPSLLSCEDEFIIPNLLC